MRFSRLTFLTRDLDAARADWGRPVQGRMIALSPPCQLRRVVFATGAAIERQGMFFETGQRQGDHLALRLGCKFNEEGSVVTDMHSETGVPGLFVCGDASEDVQFVVVAAAEGAKAGVKINAAFIRMERP
jgi:thioredoxin reductase